jgi:hypothetical protein
LCDKISGSCGGAAAIIGVPKPFATCVIGLLLVPASNHGSGAA